MGSTAVEAAGAGIAPGEHAQAPPSGEDAGRPQHASPASAASATDGCLLRPEGEYWTIVFGGRVSRLRDSVGLRHLAQLLWNPYREFPAVDLVDALAASGARRHSRPPRPRLPAVDVSAAAACLRKVRELLERLPEGEDPDDQGQTALGEELERVARDLRQCVRRRGPGMDEERARVAVAKTLRATVARIRHLHEELADHLDASLRRGYACAYRPDPRTPIRWER